ncbi:MAG: Fe-S protein assembly co-chaperone HscB [Chromatiales bacterium]|nr:Fe-S protein assembly co-chaperone HscB [Chromatiales bacterium]
MSLDNRQNYFDLFGIEPSYAVDKRALEEVYLKLQSLSHPDRFAAESEQQRRIAAQQSAYLNDAYNILSDDCSRADYLLQLRGYTTNPDASMSGDTFLMQQMEYREKLEQVAAEQSDTQAVALYDEINRQSVQINKDFEQAYNEEIFDKAQSLLTQMQFIKKLKAEVKKVIHSKATL